jgi:hypothetical protein
VLRDELHPDGIPTEVAIPRDAVATERVIELRLATAG